MTLNRNPNFKFKEAVVKADGKAYKLYNISYKCAAKTRTNIEDRQGFTQKQTGGFVKGKYYLSPGESIEELQNINDATVVWQNDTGQVYTAPHAWQEGDIEVSGDGFDIEFCFATSSELVNG